MCLISCMCCALFDFMHVEYGGNNVCMWSVGISCVTAGNGQGNMCMQHIAQEQKSQSYGFLNDSKKNLDLVLIFKM